MPQMALGLIPTTNVTPPQALSTEQINLKFQKKLEDLEQQVGGSKQFKQLYQGSTFKSTVVCGIYNSGFISNSEDF